MIARVDRWTATNITSSKKRAQQLAADPLCQHVDEYTDLPCTCSGDNHSAEQGLHVSFAAQQTGARVRFSQRTGAIRCRRDDTGETEVFWLPRLQHEEEVDEAGSNERGGGEDGGDNHDDDTTAS